MRPALLSRFSLSFLSSSSSSRGGNLLAMSSSSTSVAAPLNFGPLVSAPTVIQHFKQQGRGGIAVVDASWHLPGPDRRDAKAEFEAKHIPSASLFEIDEIADKSSSLPHMLPSADVFAERVSAMGIDQNSHVVVYTQAGCFSAARCWWTFRVFGCDKVSILDGGLPAWEAAGGEVESGKARQTGSTRPSSGLVQKGGNTWLLQKKGFQANLTPSLVKTSHQVLQHSAAGQVIVDARSVARFRAQAPEPRPGLVGGHIPGSLCVPATEVLQPDDPTSFKSKEEIRSIFEEAGVHLDNPAPIITTCGSGVTAAVLSFAMHLAGRDPLLTAVYDGSWSEWGDPARTDLPKVADE